MVELIGRLVSTLLKRTKLNRVLATEKEFVENAALKKLIHARVSLD